MSPTLIDTPGGDATSTMDTGTGTNNKADNENDNVINSMEASSPDKPSTNAETPATTTPASTTTSPKPPPQQQQGLPKAIEFEPPVACIRRILKHTLPASTNVGKDAVAAMTRSCGIFIIYLTACANDFARESKRQTITANDILAAVKELDFDEFSPQLLEFLETYRTAEKAKKDAKAAARKAEDGDTDDPTTTKDVSPTAAAPAAKPSNEDSTEDEGDLPTEEEDNNDNNDNNDTNAAGEDEQESSLERKRKRDPDDEGERDSGEENQ